MSDHDEMANIDDVEIDALTDDDLEDVAGGLAGCTCGGDSSNCSNAAEKPKEQFA